MAKAIGLSTETILLAHGGGGLLTRELIEGLIAPIFGNPSSGLPDAALVCGLNDVLVTTDSFVVKPLCFRGGDIGSLSVYGTVNDLAVSGGEPLALSLSLILEEGLEIELLRRILESAAEAAEQCGVRIVTGDTKVVSRSEADQLYITTAGVGIRRVKVDPSGVRPGDRVLLSGPVAEHGVCLLQPL